jgi:tetratricopeptide (TPR) repeat protein
MKKFAYPALIATFVILAVVIYFFKNGKQPEPIPTYLQRQGAISMTSEWLNTRAAINGLLAKLRDNPHDNDSKIKLSYAYVQEGRTTGNYMYYDNAVLTLVNEVLDDPKVGDKSDARFQALSIKATVYLNQHHFYDGLQIAEDARSISKFNSFVYGCLTDANVELGHYADAVRSADSMCLIRPDIRSYSRISYLRQILGNMKGSVNAMKIAVESGAPGLEQTEWTRVQLGKLYENLGQLDSASFQYKMALYERPNYAQALAGLARIDMDNKNYVNAIHELQTAYANVKDNAFKDELADAYLLNGQKQEALNTENEVIASMEKDAQAANGNNTLGHYADKELALAYLKTGDYDNALKHAKIEYDRRPDNIDVNEVLAWVYYKKGDFQNAKKYIDVAMRTHCQVSTLLAHAGLIYYKAGDQKKGMQLVSEAFNINPFLPIDLRQDASPILSLASANAANTSIIPVKL